MSRAAAHLAALGKGWRDSEARAKSLELTLEAERAQHAAAIGALERRAHIAEERYAQALSIAEARARLLREWEGSSARSSRSEAMLDCNQLIPHPRDASPARVPLALYTALARRLARKAVTGPEFRIAFVGDGTTDGMACLSAALNVTTYALLLERAVLL